MRWAQHELSSPRLGQQLEFSRLEMAFPYFVHDGSEVALALFVADISRTGDSQGEAACSCAPDPALAGIGQVGEELKFPNLKVVELLGELLRCRVEVEAMMAQRAEGCAEVLCEATGSDLLVGVLRGSALQELEVKLKMPVSPKKFSTIWLSDLTYTGRGELF